MTYTSRLWVAAFVVMAACDSGDDQCLYDRAGAGAPIASQEYRDPVTGTCQSFGGYDCSDPCAPCPATGAALPDWAMCYGACEGLGESACKATPSCRAIYAGSAYYDCWGVAQSGPVEGGDCSAFDAQTCSRHDDCVAIHAVGSPIGSFQSCAAEGTTQDPGSCVGTVTCGTAPPMCPSGTIAGIRNGCYTGYCIPYAQCDQLPACSTLGEAACIMRTDCTPTYAGHNCTCTGTSCTCQSWTFDACQ